MCCGVVVVWCGVVVLWCGCVVVWCGCGVVVWCGVVWLCCGVVVVWCGVVVLWCGCVVVWCGCGVVWFGVQDLHHARAWELGFVQDSERRAQYQEIASRILDSLDFMRTCGFHDENDPSVGTVCCLSPSLSHSPTRSLTHSLTHSLNHSFTHSLAHSLTHSLAQSLSVLSLSLSLSLCSRHHPFLRRHYHTRHLSFLFFSHAISVVCL